MRPLTASLLYNHLVCPHRSAMDVMGNPAEREPVSPFAQMLWERGTAHEREVMSGLGDSFLDLSALAPEQKESATREAIARREPLIYGGRLSVQELLGEPDLLRHEQGGYVAIDIKSGAGRESAEETEGEGRLRREYGVQLALYTDLLQRMGLAAGRHGYIWDVHRVETRYDLDVPLGPRSPSLWEIYLRTRAALLATLAAPEDSRPALCSACKQCVWRSACLRALLRARDLSLLPELGRVARDALVAEFPALPDLAAADPALYIHGDRTDFPRVGAKSLIKFQRRAALHCDPDATAFLTRAVQWPAARVQLFFDIETDPMRDLCYLHGFLIRERGEALDREQFEGIFIDDLSPQSERQAFAAAMAVFRRHPEAVVVHYSRYERTEYHKLARRYPEVATQQEVDSLFAAPRALDLYSDVVRPGSEWPTHDFSIKSLARHCGFNWRDADPSGAASIEWFDRWARGGDPLLRQRLLAYNEDDCLAMRVVWDTMQHLPLRTDAGAHVADPDR